ncbi:MAG: pantetheine-phosphate adenylyltransferase [Nitriliruptoraceae bacterium]
MSIAVVCPGSFDPLTHGHLDVIARAAARFDEVLVAVLENPHKQSLFTVEERMALIVDEVTIFDNVRVDRFEGLLVDFCNARGIGLICKGLRAVSDFEYELQMAQMNQRIGGVETLFLTTNPEHSYLSSSLVKEVARYGGSITGTVPPRVADALLAKLDGGGRP